MFITHSINEALQIGDRIVVLRPPAKIAYDGRRSEVSVWVPPAGTEGTDAEEDAWVQEGERLRALIQDELGPGYDVVLET